MFADPSVNKISWIRPDNFQIAWLHFISLEIRNLGGALCNIIKLQFHLRLRLQIKLFRLITAV
jgi:hypothetical protein